MADSEKMWNLFKLMFTVILFFGGLCLFFETNIAKHKAETNPMFDSGAEVIFRLDKRPGIVVNKLWIDSSGWIPDDKDYGGNPNKWRYDVRTVVGNGTFEVVKVYEFELAPKNMEK